MYVQFMQEYVQLGHITQTTYPGNEPHFYWPHQGVLKESRSTTKLSTALVQALDT